MCVCVCVCVCVCTHKSVYVGSLPYLPLPCSVPSEVVSLTARPLNGSAILLQWEPPLEPYGVDLVSYTAIAYQTGTAQYVNFDLPGNTTEFVVGNLQPSTLYTVGVYAASRTGAGPAVFVSPVMTMRLSESTRCLSVTTSSHACNLGLQHCPLDLTVLEPLDPSTATQSM